MNKILNLLEFSEPWDQKIAKVISKPFIFFHIHPNIVSLIGIALGFLTCFLYSKGNQNFANAGAVIFFFAACFDHVDGEVARKLNKTSIFGHYLDHVGVCITYITLFIGLGIWCQKNYQYGYDYGIVVSLCIFLIMTLRFYLERKKGGLSIKQKNFLGFEQEDFIYLIIPFTFIHKIENFLFFAYVGTPFFLLITIFVFVYKMKKL